MMEDFLCLKSGNVTSRDFMICTANLHTCTPSPQSFACLSGRPVSRPSTTPNIMQADSAQYKYALTLMQEKVENSMFDI